MKGKSLRRCVLGLPMALAIASCSGPTGTDGPPVAGTFLTEVRSPPRTDLSAFDPEIVAVANAGRVEITGFIPFDLCHQTLSSEFTRDGQDLVVTLNNPSRPNAGSLVCLQWVAETRYRATLTGLEAGQYRLVVIQNPARRFVDGRHVARVDTVVVGPVTVGAAQ